MSADAKRTPALLAILDGVGSREPAGDNAVTSADAPFLSELFSDTRYPCRLIQAAGRDVGLPDGQMGNSEVGHLNIGSGRIVNQELTRISLAIQDGTFFTNPVLLKACEQARDNRGTVHLMGLLSDGGVHSTFAHLQALIKLTATTGCKRVRIHVFLDGRDVAPTSGVAYLRQLESVCTATVASHMGLNLQIATVSGRYYAMDRDNRWERLECAWRCLTVPFEPDVKSVGVQQSASDLLQASYDVGVTDEFFPPVSIGEHGINDGDSVIFFNFRPDRARELTSAFIDPNFEDYGFFRSVVPQLCFVTLTEYDSTFAAFGACVAFPKTILSNTLADYLSRSGLRQLHIAETEKYAHVTFFLNGGQEEPKPNEQRILIPSPKVATYDLQPQMSAPEVTQALLEAIAQDAADVYLVNYANGDMVGHTGVLPAAIAAIEAVDAGLQQIAEAILEKDGVVLVTADHGNSEQMTDGKGNPWTAHTSAPVPLVLLAANNSDRHLELVRDCPARLADVAPTLLDAMGMSAPAEWSGRSLLVRA